MQKNPEKIKGYNFNNGLNYKNLISSYKTSGLQSTNLHKAIEITKKMILQRKKNPKNKVFLCFTSNMISCGNREIIRYLCQHKMVDAICTTSGGIEEDFMKCFKNAYIGKFKNNDRLLRKKGINRIGNMYVPNENYCDFEDFFAPLIENMEKKQIEENYNWTPSKVIDLLGSSIKDENSVYHWCHKNKIPVFCTAITDGAVGDVLFFNSYKYDKLKVDLVEDIWLLNDLVVDSNETGAVILGGGMIKHQILSSNAFKGGLDYTVLINTGVEYDGSESGAKCEEEISWGKIKKGSEYVKVHAEASLVFPLLVAETFAQNK